MKKVSIIVPYFVPPYIGGTETVLRHWHNFFNDSETELNVHFVLPFVHKGDTVFGKVQSKEKMHMCLRIFNNKLLIQFFGSLYLLFYLVLTNADFVVVLSPKYIRLSAAVRRVFKKKYNIISWMHFSLDKMFTDQRQAFKKADYHFAISSGIKYQLINMGIDSKKISVIFNPVESKQKSIKRSMEPKYLYIGRIEKEKQKNLNELISGFRKVLNVLPTACLDIWGDGADRHVLENEVREYHLENQVVFHGWNENPWQHVYESTALVMTSTFEGLPMTILEAISYGIPVISSDIQTGPVDEINIENGRLYSLGKIDELKSEMIDVYKKSDLYGPESIKKSIDKFYMNNYFQQIIGVFKRLE